MTKGIQSKLTDSEFRTWFSHATLKKLEGDSVVISVPNRYHALWLEDHYLSLIEGCFEKKVKRPQKVSFSYEHGARTQDSRGSLGGALNPSMTFGEMLEGEWNRFAHSSALQVTENEARTYSPLYIHSKPGLGKTHLLHAIGNRITLENPDIAVRYIPSILFMSEFTRYSGKEQAQYFEERYSSLDVLLFDDVHLVSKRPNVQKELVLIFDTLYALRRKMVFTADRPVHDLTGVDKPLRSRLGWGVLAEIGTPDQNTLQKIIRKKAKECAVQLPEEVFFYLSHANKDLNGLNRNVLKLKSYSAMKEGQINLPIAMSLIKKTDQKIGMDDIKLVIADYFDMPIHDLTSGGKKRSHSYPRQVAMYLARKYTDLSFKEIGRSFGQKDHSTVIHAIRRVEEKREREKPSSDDLARLEELFS